jgi:leucyl/phenylalanyl-tRNA--protein transferase
MTKDLRRRFFPDPLKAGDQDVIAAGPHISVELLLEAYNSGIFPWPQEGLPVLWFSPVERGILDFSDFKIARSLQKILQKNPFEIRWNTAFRAVITACQTQKRPGQSGTWITDEMLEAYVEFHHLGYAHSVECWREDQLVGGVYGVFVAGVFGGESMFHFEPNASKVALVALIQSLIAQGFDWMDIQMVTPLLEAMGGKYIPRSEYIARLELSKARKRVFKIDFRK